jgi:DNA-binding transcriptional regulator/RsmH inhibitor MraZ
MAADQKMYHVCDGGVRLSVTRVLKRYVEIQKRCVPWGKTGVVQVQAQAQW